MSPIWLRSGSPAVNSDGSIALVRAWTYNGLYAPPCWAGHGLPSSFVIVGCSPPACVKYRDSTKFAGWAIYQRGACSAWSGSGGYAWPSDIPDCPYPDGITIEEVDCDERPNLGLSISASGDEDKFEFFSDCPDEPAGDKPYVRIGAMEGTGGWNIGCTYEFGYIKLTVNCNGSVSYYDSLHAPYGGMYYDGSGGYIALNSNGVPVGSTTVYVYGQHSDYAAYYGAFSVTTSVI